MRTYPILAFSALLLTPKIQAATTNLFIDDVGVLMNVEEHGYAFADQVSTQGVLDLAHSLEADLAKMAVGRKDTGPAMKYSRRTFDGGWLKSKKSRFELAGITFRPDRAFLHPNRCGEVRLIYRLAYTDDRTGIASRLPMTIQQVRTVPPPCAGALGRWSTDAGAVKKFLDSSAVYDFELNLQSVRWPAAIRPDMGGYAEYMMRAFVPKDGGLLPKSLFNTIDVKKLQTDPKLKAELLAWLKVPANVEAVDRGEAVLADKFLTEKISSVAVHGLNRKANRLFDQVFVPQDFAAVDFKATQFVKSPTGYLRKLEELTCIGCHQSKSIAGFHFLGKDRPGSVAFNKVRVPFSYHFITDQQRRRDGRPLGFVDRPQEAKGLRNERCYVGTDPSFVGWTCDKLVCEPVGSAVGTPFFGVCQGAEIAEVGDACYFGRTSQGVDSMRDREVQPKEKACRDPLGCLHPSDGYPGGLCFANSCDPESGKACAALAVPGFNPCLAQGRPFKECLEKFTGSIDAAYCDESTPCRDDFICAEGFKGKGVCAPPYSLFQLRVDGHGRP